MEDGDAGWTTDGWQRTANRLPQTWALRLVRYTQSTTTVEALQPAADGTARATLAPGERGVLMIAGTTPHTTEPASYTLTVNDGQ